MNNGELRRSNRSKSSVNYDDTERRCAPSGRKDSKKGNGPMDNTTVVTGPTVETMGSDSEDDAPRLDYNNPAKDTSQNKELLQSP